MLQLTEDSSIEDQASLLVQAMQGMEGSDFSQDIACLIERLLPLATLVPEVYSDWRPVVIHGFHYLVSQLSHERLVPKIIQQLLLPDTIPTEQRLALFMQQMPCLQKLGQVLARNSHISTGLREQLIKLEDSINDVTYRAIKQVLHDELGDKMQQYQIHMDSQFLAEASVSAVIRFCWVSDIDHRIRGGVFKVLKPYIPQYFHEETELLKGLGTHLQSISDEHILRQADLESLFEDIRSLLIEEIDFRQEQQSLVMAADRYRNRETVCTPQLIESLCTDKVTAMTQIPGVKVTEAYRHETLSRSQLTRRLITTLLIEPMLDKQETTIFHADPHAGNLLVNEQNGCLGILDWALTEQLTREDRRQCIMLFCGVFLCDESLIEAGLIALSEKQLRPGQMQAMKAAIKRNSGLQSWFSAPGVHQLMELLDAGLKAGIHYKRSLVVFRKVLLTLQGVIHDISPGTSVDVTVMYYLYNALMAQVPALSILQNGEQQTCLPLNSEDAVALMFSLQTWGLRRGLAAGGSTGIWGRM